MAAWGPHDSGLDDVLKSADFAGQIRTRAETVYAMGEYIGMFELMIYSALRQRRVLVCFGTEVIDATQLFAPWLVGSWDSPYVSPSGSLSARAARFAGCVPGAGGKLLAVRTKYGYPRISHWVIGIPLDGPPCVGDTASSASATVDAKQAARKAGCNLRRTELRGNCGIDAMLYHDAVNRDEESWRATRKELRDKMVAVV